MVRRFGKSLLANLARDYVHIRGGQLISDTTKDGLRTEVFAMPNKKRWAFVTYKKESSGISGGSDD